MLKQIAWLYGASWLAALLAAAVLEWRQLTMRGAGTGRGGAVKRAAFGWVTLPVAAPALLVLALARRRARRAAG